MKAVRGTRTLSVGTTTNFTKNLKIKWVKTHIKKTTHLYLIIFTWESVKL